jgi:ABC-2 type transport system permease protein
MVAGAIFLLVTLMGMGVGEMALSRADGNVEVNGQQVSIQGLDLGRITSNMSAKDMTEFAQGINGALYVSAGWSLLVFGFVVFFYLLGALYDERKDRSVLFWKSLPISDAETVLSKVTMAIVVGPLVAIAAGLVTMLGFLLLLGLFAAIHGANPMTLVWGPANPLDVIANLLGSLPIYALWALPTVGWLLLCSSWARSKPFLWAIMIPVFAGILIGWFGLMHIVDLDLTSAWYWKNIAGRVLTSTWPGTSLAYATAHDTMSGPQAMAEAMRPYAVLGANYRLLLNPSTWIGAFAGAAMIFGAIRMRRYRDEG